MDTHIPGLSGRCFLLLGVYIRTQASGKCTGRHIGSSCLVKHDFVKFYAYRGFTDFNIEEETRTKTNRNNHREHFEKIKKIKK